MSNTTPIKSTNVDYEYFDAVKPMILNIMNNKYSKPMNSGFGAKIKNVIVTFDTETTNAKDHGIKKPYIYSYCVTIMSMDIYRDENNKQYGKAVSIRCGKIEQFKKIVKYLCKVAGCLVSKEVLDNKPVQNGTEDYHNYDSSNDVYLNFYTHNLPFDFSFIIDEFKLRTLFCSAPHKPYYALTWEGARFIDTAVLTMKTLEQLGNSLMFFNVKKQVGDLDYNKIRTSDTTFTDKELGYIYSDTITLAAYMWELAAGDYKGRLCDIPLTQTGKVRRFTSRLCSGNKELVKQMIEYGFTFGTAKEKTLKTKSKKRINNITGMQAYHDMNNNRLSHNEREVAERKFNKYCEKRGSSYRKFIKRLRIAKPADYWQMKESYSGGFTHGSPLHIGEVNHDVASFDFKSSYPAVIVSEEFPMGMYTRETYTTDEFLKRLKNKKKDHKAYMFRMSFENIQCKLSDEYDDYLSESKVRDAKSGEPLIDSNAVYSSFNGRISMAHKGYVYITDVDWETISKVYSIDGLKFDAIMEFNTAPLPQVIIMAVLYFYREKTKLKHIVGSERDYLRSKEMLNAIYGMMVQDPLNPVITYRNDGTWKREKMIDSESVKKAIDEYNESNSRFLWYPWGIYVAAYARRNLWTGIIACGTDYLYSDTDSIKIINKNKHMKYINDYNNEVISKIHKICDYYQIPYEFTCPENNAKEKQQLGIWDADDGYYSYFKTLGAKRYIDIDKESNKLEITIAGLSKKAGRDWLLKKSKVKHNGAVIEGNPEPIFDVFNRDMTVPVGKAGKLTHTYVTRFSGFDITDYQGHKTHIEAGSGCFLEPAGFTLSISESFITAITHLQDGYLVLRSTAMRSDL